MIKSGIEINWDGSKEYIPIDFGRLSEHEEICSTLEWWTAERCFVSYVTNGAITPQADGSFQLKIKYERSKNRHVPQGAVYGTSTIRLEKSSKFGYAFWHEVGEQPEREPAKWKRVSLEVTKKKIKTTHTVTRTERRQAFFRFALLGRYRCCAITNETTPSALEAAHVIASSKNGNEVIGNGILLRADIHRLYDGGAFRISRDGLVIVNKKFPLSTDYRDLLYNAVLPSEVIADLAS